MGATDERLDVENFVFSQSIDFVLSSLALYGEIFGGDATTMVIFFAMARASVAHVNRDNVIRPEAKGGVLPDALRRPVSIMGISDYLGFPYETTRRHVMKLVERGLCRRVGSREFLIDAEVLSRPEFAAMARANFQRVRRFHAHVAAHLEL